MRWDPRVTVLVDTNLLLVLVVGWVAPEQVGRVGRTAGYTTEDFDRLVFVINAFKYMVTTPHVLCETSNLVCRSANEELADQLAAVLQRVYVITDERFVTARKLSRDTVAAPLGLADCAMLEAARHGCTVLSADLRLCNELTRRGLQVINFTRVRFANLDAAG